MMPFDFANRGLVQKVSMLVLGIALFVSIAIGGAGDLLLKRVVANLVQAKLPSSVASLAQIVDRGDATVTPIMGADGNVIGVVMMGKNTGAGIIPASFAAPSKVQNVAAGGLSLDELSGLGATRRMLLLICVFVFAGVTLVGMKIACGFLDPLVQLTKEVDRLAKGDTTVKLSALDRIDEIGQIARSAATIQESLAELARLKAAQGVEPRGTVLLRIWEGFRARLGQARELMASEGRMLGSGVTMLLPRSSATSVWRGWKAWLSERPPPNCPTAA
jgi:hypothetical protein